MDAMVCHLERRKKESGGKEFEPIERVEVTWNSGQYKSTYKFVVMNMQNF